jgi:hypothetical protein
VRRRWTPDGRAREVVDPDQASIDIAITAARSTRAPSPSPLAKPPRRCPVATGRTPLPDRRLPRDAQHRSRAGEPRWVRSADPMPLHRSSMVMAWSQGPRVDADAPSRSAPEARDSARPTPTRRLFAGITAATRGERQCDRCADGRQLCGNSRIAQRDTPPRGRVQPACPPSAPPSAPLRSDSLPPAIGTLWGWVGDTGKSAGHPSRPVDTVGKVAILLDPVEKRVRRRAGVADGAALLDKSRPCREFGRRSLGPPHHCDCPRTPLCLVARFVCVRRLHRFR